MQDVNKEPGAEDKFKKIGEAYEVSSMWLGAGMQAWDPARANWGHGPHCRPPLFPQVLSDENKKAIYDRYGEAGLKSGAGGFPGGAGMGGQGDFSNPFDLFESFFGAGMGRGGATGQSRNRAVPGEDER